MAIALGALGVIALVVALIVLRVRAGVAPPTRSADSVRAIAVLPFDDVSPAKDQEYFATGMADELVTALARLPNLRVAARTSSFALRNTTLSPAEIGRRLRVSALLTGSIAKDGNRLRIRTELVDVNADSVLWRRSFDRELKDVFEVQEQIAQTVVSQLRVLGAGGKSLVTVPTNDTAAYALYLRGRLAWNERTAGSLGQAVSYFKQAIAKDSGYARAWAGLADTYNVIGLNFYGHRERTSSSVVKRRARPLRSTPRSPRRTPHSRRRPRFSNATTSPLRNPTRRRSDSTRRTPPPTTSTRSSSSTSAVPMTASRTQSSRTTSTRHHRRSPRLSGWRT
jgi:TolB-like protein